MRGGYHRMVGRLEMGNNREGKSLAGYDTCHCLGAIYCFTAFMHIIYIYCCLLGGMCVHFKFPGLERYIVYTAYMCIR